MVLRLIKNTLFSLVFLFPTIIMADWLATNGCTQNTVQPTCIKALESCDAKYSYVITESILTLEPDGVTPAFVNITYDVTNTAPANGDSPYTLYNQRGQCGWSDAACTDELPYDPETEACTKSPEILTCGHASLLHFFTSESGFTSADAAATAFCEKIDALDNVDYPFIGNTGSGVDGNGGDIFTTCGQNTYTSFVSCSNVVCSVGEVLNYSTNTCVTPSPNILQFVKTLGLPICDSISPSVGN